MFHAPFCGFFATAPRIPAAFDFARPIMEWMFQNRKCAGAAVPAHLPSREPRLPASDRALEHRLLAAQAIAREAGALARRRFRERPSVLSLAFKGPQDYVLASDAEVESLLRLRLAEAFPEDAFFGEEEGGAFGRAVGEGEPQGTWVVDPIDGTANFARGIPHWCVSLSFVRDGQALIGVIYDPPHGQLYAAARGRGATLDGALIRVSGLSEIAQATIEAGWSPRVPLDSYVGAVERLKAAGAAVRRAGSGALALAFVAAGRMEAYVELHMNAWDALAGLVLVEEAGGWVNDYLAGEALTKGNAILACTPELREALSEATGVR
jgi:myo-inositol-1(or 4)-monophosphatase